MTTPEYTRRLAGAAAALLIPPLLASLATPLVAHADAYAQTKRLPSDPPRIPLSKGVVVVLPDQDPLALVKALYARPSSYLGKVSGYRKAFMPDLARAMAQDLQPLDEAVIGFDWRYGGPAAKAEGLSFETHPRPGAALVIARFRLAGEERRTELTLFKRRTGWRVHDVSQTSPKSWGLRACLKMKRAIEVSSCDTPPPEPGLNTPPKAAEPTPVASPRGAETPRPQEPARAPEALKPKR
jgi:hypothetical protein